MKGDILGFRVFGMKLTIGMLCILLAVLCFSIIEVISVLAFTYNVDYLSLLSVRLIIGGLFFVITLMLFTKESFQISRSALPLLAVFAASMLIHLVSFWAALVSIKSVPVAVGVFYTFPVMIVLVTSVILRTRIKASLWASMILGCVGTLFLTQILPGMTLEGVDITGILVMLGSALMWAVTAIVGEKLFKLCHQFVALLYTFGISAAVILAVKGPALVALEISSVPVWEIAVLGVVSTFLAYLFMYTGIKIEKPVKGGLLMYTKPFFATALALAVLGQAIDLLQAAGMVLIFLSAYLVISHG